MNNTKTRLWTKDFVIITLGTFFVFMPFYILMTNLTLYAMEQFGASESMAGLSVSIFVIGELVSRLFTGKYIEIIGRKKVLYGGLVLFLLATLLYFIAGNLGLLLITRFFHGAAFGIAATAMTTIAMDVIPDKRRGEGTSYYSMAMVLGTALGPFVGVFLTQHADSQMLFVACTVFSVISIITAMFVRIPKVIITKAQIEKMKSFKLSEFIEFKSVPAALIMGLMCFLYAGVLSFLAPYAKEIGLLDAASYFFIIYAIFVLIFRPVTGKLFDKKGENFIIYPAFVLYIASMILLSQATNSFALLASGVLVGLGYGTIASSSQAIAIKEAPKHRVGMATSTFFIGANVGMGIGPFILGFLIPVLGYEGLYLFIAGMIAISLFIYYLVHGRIISARQRVEKAPAPSYSAPYLDDAGTVNAEDGVEA